MFEAGATLKQRYGDDQVFDLSLGNPVMEPPQEFHQELQRLAADPVPGMHRYMPNAGYPETRAAVAAQLAKEIGQPFQAGDVVMCCGAGAGLNVVLRALLNPGEQVVLFAPYFVEYRYYVDNHNGIPQVAPTDSSFNPDLKALEGFLTPNTKAVIINSPNNPTGVVYSAELLERLGKLLQRKERQYGTEIFLISDEPYRKLLFDGLPYPHVLPHHQRTIVVTSHSKDLALPGERIGYIAAHPQYEGKEELLEAITFCTRTLGFVNAPALMQRLVQRLQNVSVDVSQYQRKRDLLYDNLTAMGYEIVKPQGAFYMFPKTPLEDDVAFGEMLLHHNILVVPGSGFGTPGYFRISYCVEDRVLEGSLNGFEAVLHELRKE